MSQQQCEISSQSRQLFQWGLQGDREVRILAEPLDWDVDGAPEVLVRLEGRVIEELQAEVSVLLGHYLEGELAPALVAVVLPVEEDKVRRILGSHTSMTSASVMYLYLVNSKRGCVNFGVQTHWPNMYKTHTKLLQTPSEYGPL